MKYKVGDKVRIKSLDWYNMHCDDAGNVDCDCEIFEKDMKPYLGKVFTIHQIVDNSKYEMEEAFDFFLFTDEMIEGLVEDECPQDFIEKYCKSCGTQRCDRTKEYLNGCPYYNAYRCSKKEEETKPEPKFKVGDRVFDLATKMSVNIIEWDEETGLYIVRYDDGVLCRSLESELKRLEHITLDDVKDETKPKDMGEVSDGYHTFNELYEYRLLYNASMFNEFAKQNLYDVHKSKRHYDGEIPFGDPNWFIVMAELPTGQISNHYEMKDWDLFDIPEKAIANEWDGHTPKDVAERLRRFLTPKPKYPQTYEECCKVMGVNHTNDLDICEHCDYKTEITYYEDSLLEKIEALYRLIICRDAYWKIAGVEIGLGKPWELSIGTPIYYIYYNRTVGTIKNDHADDIQGNIILAFPTAEMRDAFYENFKEEIEICKELL